MTVPVTILTGFLGSGKTTMLNRLLEESVSENTAVIINEFGDTSIDSHLVIPTKEEIIEINSGCICCTLREDLLVEVEKFAAKGEFDHILIESSGISEPIPVAQTFSYIDETMGIDLTRYCRLDTMVTVIDANRFWHDFGSGETLIDRRHGISEADDRNIADLLLDQIEFCNVLFLNKTDLVEEQHLKQLEDVIKKLQPEAKIIRTEHSKVNPKDILNTGMFNFEKASESAGWLKELTAGVENHTPETEEHGIGSFVFYSSIPFHAERFASWYQALPENIVRVKGVIWCATHNDMALLFSQAGPYVEVRPLSYWVASLPESQINDILSANPEVKVAWDKDYGDRHTKMVFIGTDLDQEEITEELNHCLMSPSEMQSDWSELKNPFPWKVNQNA